MTREEVVKWLESLKKEIGKAENRTLWHYAESIDMAIEALADRPTGEWIEKIIKGDSVWTQHRYYCSVCGGWNTYGKSDYCPNCGAKMRGEEE